MGKPRFRPLALETISTVYSLSILVTFHPERNHMIVSLALAGTAVDSTVV
jgi:hypothetical protein